MALAAPPMRGYRPLLRLSSPWLASILGYQVRIETKVVPKVASDQKLLSHPLESDPAHLPPTGLVPKEFDCAIGGLFCGCHKIAVHPILDLNPDASDVAPDHGDTLPQR